jgi:hypothetical protein
MDGRSVQTAITDSLGNIFLTTSVPNECVLIKRKPPPRTSAKIEVKGESLRATLSANTAGRHWFSWKIDNGDWSEFAERGNVTIDSIENGRHTFVARTADESLDIDAHGAIVPFTVKVDRDKAVAEAIIDLSSADFGKRERAVGRLAGQPAIALPKLKITREKATPEVRWWIEAAIQEIERSSRNSSKAPSY